MNIAKLVQELEAKFHDNKNGYNHQRATAEEMKALRKEYLSTLTEVKNMNFQFFKEIHPSALKVGDLVMGQGFTGKVEKVSVFSNDDLPCYVAYVSYVAGDVSLYKWFGATACNGCATSPLAKIQGNERAKWHVVE